MAISIDYKKRIKETLTLLPLLFASGYFILWLYLNDIGQLVLLSSILNDKGTLIALIISFIILSLGLVFTFSFPSMILCQMCFLTWNNEFSRVIKLSKIPLISCCISILYIATIIAFSIIKGIPSYIQDYIFIITLLLFSPITFAAIHFFSKKREKIHIYYKKGKEIRNKNFIKEKLIISFFCLYSGIAITIPLLFILRLSTAYSNTGLFIFFAISLILVFISFLPAIVFFSDNNLKSHIKTNVILFITTSLTLFFIIMLLLPNFSALVVRGALKNIGVIESDAHIYSLKKQNYTNDMFPTTVWTHINPPLTNDKYLFIKGTIIFSLGDNVLICPEFVTKAQDKYKKYNLDNILTFNKSDFQDKYLRQLIKSCALINKSDITRWDSIMDGQNLLNLQYPHQ
ncbi:hypothetical protein PWF83_08195 [Pantoea dispersa]|uniref:hypothetical protein n=1 Tax=Pantoea dispersa TaxID=59814 RepID=UPI0023A9EACC|nr:hypothetical protein [Pantoea dispersa]WEA07346.1 hypothetical protein PWF83_08195 [Pantoea dispersa]